MLIQTAAATGNEPVTLAEAKTHMAIIGAADDTMIESAITAAREMVESWTGRALIAAARRFTVAEARCLRLPLWPAAVTAVTYLDSEGERQAVAGTDYTFDPYTGHLTLDAKRASVAVDFTTDLSEVVIPESLKDAIKLIVGDLYENREAAVVGTNRSDNPTVARLVTPWRLNLGA